MNNNMNLVKQMDNLEIKKGNLNYDQSGRAYPDNPRVKKKLETYLGK